MKYTAARPLWEHAGINQLFPSRESQGVLKQVIRAFSGSMGKVDKNGKRWIINTMAQWLTHWFTCCSKRTVQRVFKKLKELGVLTMRWARRNAPMWSLDLVKLKAILDNLDLGLEDVNSRENSTPCHPFVTPINTEYTELRNNHHTDSKQEQLIITDDSKNDDISLSLEKSPESEALISEKQKDTKITLLNQEKIPQESPKTRPASPVEIPKPVANLLTMVGVHLHGLKSLLRRAKKTKLDYKEPEHEVQKWIDYAENHKATIKNMPAYIAKMLAAGQSAPEGNPIAEEVKIAWQKAKSYRLGQLRTVCPKAFQAIKNSGMGRDLLRLRDEQKAFGIFAKHYPTEARQ